MQNRSNTVVKITLILVMLITASVLIRYSVMELPPRISRPTALGSHHPSKKQLSMSPDEVLQDLVDGNKRFYSSNKMKRPSLVALSQRASLHGQFPIAVVLACMDSRSVPEIIFDQTIGDIFTLRVAGNVVNEYMIASMEYATKISGSKVIVIMGHTQCGAIKAACGGKASGNLEALVNAIAPAVELVRNQTSDGQLDCNNDEITQNIAMQNVRTMIARVIEGSPVIRELLEAGTIKIVGALHNLESGIVTFF